MKKNLYFKPKINKKRLKINFYLDIGPDLLARCIPPCPSGCRCYDPGSNICVDGNTCFLPGTEILMADNSSCRIEDIKPGDKVISYDLETGELRPSIVNKLIVHQEDPSGFYLINNYLKVTGHHRIWVKNKGWTTVFNLKIDDEVFTSKKKYVRIKTKEKVEGTYTVYNLSLKDKLHNFFAGGILVHNIKICN